MYAANNKNPFPYMNANGADSMMDAFSSTPAQLIKTQGIRDHETVPHKTRKIKYAIRNKCSNP